jgi:hypothetical protein
MPGFPLTIAASCSCFHQAPALIAPTQGAVLILGQPVATMDCQISVVGCPFTIPPPPGKYQPCVLIRWSQPSTKVLVQGKPMMVMPPPGLGIGPGICQSAEQIPQGAPVVKTNQMKVFVT